MNNLSDILDNFWGSELMFEKFDFCNHKIHIKIKTTDNDKISVYNLILVNVSSFCWINEQCEMKNNIDTWDFLQLESISISTKVKTKIIGDEWDNQFYSKPNLIFEIWNSALFVEAEEIIINDRVYKIN